VFAILDSKVFAITAASSATFAAAASLRAFSSAVDSILQQLTAYYSSGQHIKAVDSILQQWTAYYRIGQHISAVDSILQQWTAYYNSG
jgi:hypothetical protein